LINSRTRLRFRKRLWITLRPQPEDERNKKRAAMKARAQKIPPKRRREIARNAARARWACAAFDSL
jgi:hypothetical protein